MVSDGLAPDRHFPQEIAWRIEAVVADCLLFLLIAPLSEL
jgi:hypothetical protein